MGEKIKPSKTFLHKYKGNFYSQKVKGASITEAGCDPLSQSPCCSPYKKACGNSFFFCGCSGCVDYRIGDYLNIQSATTIWMHSNDSFVFQFQSLHCNWVTWIIKVWPKLKALLSQIWKAQTKMAPLKITRA